VTCCDHFFARDAALTRGVARLVAPRLSEEAASTCRTWGRAGGPRR